MTLHLKIWRQASANDKGSIQDYTLEGVSPDQSFLEMLDTLNEKLAEYDIEADKWSKIKFFCNYFFFN